MAVFSVGGLVSGINYNDLISKILEIERRPMALLQARRSDYDAKISAYADLSSKLSALGTAAKDLAKPATFFAKRAQASDATVFDAAASSTAAAGNYSLSVDRLAQAHRIASSGVAAETDVVGTGDGNFSFQVGKGATTTVAVTAATTLAQLRDAVNAAGGDAEASIIYDGSLYRLVLTSKTPGASGAITVTENATSLGLPSGPVAGGATLQAAQDASFSIDGLLMTSGDNVVENALSGVTITLKKTGAATLSVTNDTAAIRAKIEAFVAAYNDVVSFVSSSAYYDAAARRGGPLSGEGTARELVLGLQAIAGRRVAGLPEDLRALSQAGIATGKDGRLSVDAAVLEGKLSANLSGVADLFASEGGVADQVYAFTESAGDAVSGAVALRKKGLERIASGLSDDVKRLEERLAMEEEALRKRFAALEALVSGLSAQSAFLSGLVQKG